MEIFDLKQSLVDTLGSIDKGKLNLYDLKTYAEILKTVADTHTANYEEILSKSLEALNKPYTPPSYPTISEMKGETDNGV